MQTETHIDTIKEMIAGLLQEHPTHFLVEVRIKPTNNVKVFVDADEGGKGKAKETKQESILFDHIKSTKIQIKF